MSSPKGSSLKIWRRCIEAKRLLHGDINKKFGDGNIKVNTNCPIFRSLAKNDFYYESFVNRGLIRTARRGDYEAIAADIYYRLLSFFSLESSLQSKLESLSRGWEDRFVVGMQVRVGLGNSAFLDNCKFLYMQDVETFVQWCIGIANDASHGYDQASRNGPDYDCSSFATQSYREAGVDIGGGSGVYTGNMLQYYTEVGFEAVYDVNFSTQEGLMRGDVLLNTVHHTAIYLGNGRIVQASSDRGNPQTGDQTGTEIWETGYYDYPWDVVLRYKGGGTPPEPVGLYITRFIPA